MTSTFVMAKIESIFEHMVDALSNELSSMDIAINTRPVNRPRTSTPPPTHNAAAKKIAFPAKSEGEAWRFSELRADMSRCHNLILMIAVAVRILELMHNALRNNLVLTKR